MNTDLLLQSIAKHIMLDETESELLVSFFKHWRLRKKQFVFQEGVICKYTSFVLSGCLRSYAIDENGVEHIFQFATEGWWMNDMYSFNNQIPGMMNADALEDSEILMISKEDQEELYRKIPQYERYSSVRLTQRMALSTVRKLCWRALWSSRTFSITSQWESVSSSNWASINDGFGHLKFRPIPPFLQIKTCS